eukprot:8080874-Pyramimonas_sp.AAC.1
MRMRRASSSVCFVMTVRLEGSCRFMHSTPRNRLRYEQKHIFGSSNSEIGGIPSSGSIVELYPTLESLHSTL